MSYLEISSIFLGASLGILISMAFLRPPTAKRVLFVGWILLTPVLAVSCGAVSSLGEEAFLSGAEAVNFGTFFMMMSLVIGFLESIAIAFVAGILRKESGKPPRSGLLDE